jgi:Fe-S-cluster formation regulator IscX/YfhJ
MVDRSRVDRLQKIAIEMDEIVREIGPKWIKLAHLRKESQSIMEELRDDAEKF